MNTNCGRLRRSGTRSPEDSKLELGPGSGIDLAEPDCPRGDLRDAKQSHAAPRVLGQTRANLFGIIRADYQ